MERTTIMLPLELKVRAQQLARRLGISFGELVRDSLQSRLAGAAEEIRDHDPLFEYRVHRDRGVRDLAERHDELLYDED